MEFKIGDEVEILDDNGIKVPVGGSVRDIFKADYHGIPKEMIVHGSTVIYSTKPQAVAGIWNGYVIVRFPTNPNNYEIGYSQLGFERKNLRLIKSKNSFMKNLKEIVSGIFATEPQKSRQAAGIVDKEGKLTADGKDVFLDFLLSKENPADENGFDKKIVAPVLAEIEKNNKK